MISSLAGGTKRLFLIHSSGSLGLRPNFKLMEVQNVILVAALVTDTISVTDEQSAAIQLNLGSAFLRFVSSRVSALRCIYELSCH